VVCLAGDLDGSGEEGAIIHGQPWGQIALLAGGWRGENRLADEEEGEAGTARSDHVG